MKPLSDAQYAFKAAVRRAVKMAGGNSAAAEVVRAHGSQLSNYGNTDQPTFAPVDIAFELDRAAGDHVILRAWADLCGFDLVDRNAEANASADLTVAAGQVARESGELVSAAIEASADGIVTPREAASINEAASDLAEKVIDIQRAARRAAGAA